MNRQIQKMRLIVNGAVCLYEGQGLEICQILKAQNRDYLLTVLDALTTALYWIRITSLSYDRICDSGRYNY